MFMRRFLAFLTFTLAFPVVSAWAFTMVSYNVENLFDIDGVAQYEDYKPARYPPANLAVKVANIARVLKTIGNGQGPDIIAFNEIELDQTPESTVKDSAAWLESMKDVKLSDLRAQLSPELEGVPAEMWLLKACEDAGLKGYHIALTNEKSGNYEDGRPISVHSMIFSRFLIQDVRTHQTPNARAILEVTLDVNGKPLSVFANHWKSGAGDPGSEEIRMGNARTLRGRLDQILKNDPSADVIICGDFNSHYNQNARYPEIKKSGLIDVLRSQGNETALLSGTADLYNLWFELPENERGSDIYRNEWGTLMNILVTRGLYDKSGIQYLDNSFKVVRIPGLNADVLGRPIRWNKGGRPGGFSDHFPVMAEFQTVDTKAKDQWITLKNPSTIAQGSGEPVIIGSLNDLFQNAIDPSQEPQGTDFRDATYQGRVFKLNAPARINSRGIVSIFLNNTEFEIFTPIKELRPVIREMVQKTGKLQAYGDIGKYRDRWQFVIHDKNWLSK